jgi:hypothetical protein
MLSLLLSPFSDSIIAPYSRFPSLVSPPSKNRVVEPNPLNVGYLPERRIARAFLLILRPW